MGKSAERVAAPRSVTGLRGTVIEGDACVALPGRRGVTLQPEIALCPNDDGRARRNCRLRTGGCAAGGASRWRETLALWVCDSGGRRGSGSSAELFRYGRAAVHLDTADLVWPNQSVDFATGAAIERLPIDHVRETGASTSIAPEFGCPGLGGHLVDRACLQTIVTMLLRAWRQCRRR